MSGMLRCSVRKLKVVSSVRWGAHAWVRGRWLEEGGECASSVGNHQVSFSYLMGV